MIIQELSSPMKPSDLRHRQSGMTTTGVCKVEDCGRTTKYKDLCGGHYQQMWNGKPFVPLKPRAVGSYKGAACLFEGCERPAAKLSLCDGHYQQANTGARQLFPIGTTGVWHNSRMPSTCTADGCDRASRGALCSKHSKLNAKLKTLYGITLAERDKMLADQGGRCLICPRAATDVDHDHATGLVRGLLCGDCNRAIGLFRDDPSLLRAAAHYIEGVVA